MSRMFHVGLALLALPLMPLAASDVPRPASSVSPVTDEPPSSITLTDAVARTLAENPGLRAAGFELRALESRREQAGLRPPLELRVEAEDFLGSGNLRGIDALETTLRLGTVIERGGKRARRIDRADSERALLAVEQDTQRLDLLAEVARRFIHVVADQEALVLTRRATELGRRSQSLVTRRVRAAKAGEAESSKATIALARAEIAEEHARHELNSARVTLTSAWNVREPDFVIADASFFDLPEPQPLQTLVASLDRNPDLARFASERRVREAQLALARSERSSDVTLNAGVRRLEAFDDQALVFGISVPLGAASRAVPYEREVESRLQAVESREAAARADLYRTLYALYQELLHARTQADTLRERVIPQAEKALRVTEDGYELGRYSYLELVDAQQLLLTVQREAIEAARDYHLFFVELERLAGRALGVTAATKEMKR
ncbi:MAG: TolC family protein [Gammaproteobacteria bacterium]|nr:TolC family protein [Gammaproteobacteria bacterium]